VRIFIGNVQYSDPAVFQFHCFTISQILIMFFVPDFNMRLCVNTALGADVLIITVASCHPIRTEHEDN
jgi:hypothetical protein